MAKKTEDGLAVVSERTFLEFLQDYDINAENNDPVITQRIRYENPQIYRILDLGMQNAPTREAQTYYECGIQIMYELLRRQTDSNSKEECIKLLTI